MSFLHLPTPRGQRFYRVHAVEYSAVLVLGFAGSGLIAARVPCGFRDFKERQSPSPPDDWFMGSPVCRRLVDPPGLGSIAEHFPEGRRRSSGPASPLGLEQPAAIDHVEI